jgi:nanoRNase/pAp phosphatase (c-di-AMP/oligoRNAs hydrolase)
MKSEPVTPVEDETSEHSVFQFLARVREAVEGVETPRVCIVMQHTPDPDALGCALGIQFLLERMCGVPSDLCYAGEVSHPQNRTEVNVLDMRLSHVTAYAPELYSYHLVVDATPQNTGEFEKLVEKWDAVIDHHQFDLDLPHTDIRSVGACSSIVWDYLRACDIGFDSERAQVVATALFFGIVNDTHGLLSDNTCKLDLAAHAALIPYIDKKRYQEIVLYPLPPYLFELRSRAAENMVVEASALISYLGRLTEKRRDALPMMADEFLRMEGVETVVVFAMIGPDIQASVRSSNSSVNVHTFCQKVFGERHAGGKQGSGGARVPIGFLHSSEDSEEHRQELSKFARELLTMRIVRYLSGA